MNLFKRILSAILLLCMIFTMIPPVQRASAAENVTYQLATGGIIPVSAQDAVASVCILNEIMAHLAEQEPVEVPQPQPIDPSLMEEATQAQAQVTQQLFTDVRSWLDPGEGGAE